MARAADVSGVSPDLRSGTRSQYGQLSKYLLPGLTGVALISGLLIKGPPANPDVEFRPIQVLGVFLVFAAFALSVIGWGAFITEKLGLTARGRLPMALAFGTVFASLSAMALGYAGLISYELMPLAVAWVFAGALLGSASLPPESFSLKPGWSWLPAAAVWLVFADWLLRCSLTHGTTDPFFYHLVGPRDWTDAGRITFHVMHPSSPHANYWESLFVWGNMLLGDREGLGLIEGQIFAQYAHVGLGVGMCAAVAYRFAAEFVAWVGWAWIAALTVFGNQAMFAYAWLAKNDYGVTGWVLAGAMLLYLESKKTLEKRRLELFLAGALIGIGTIGKIVYVSSVIPLLFVWTAVTLARGWKDRKTAAALKEVLLVACGCIAGLAPVMIRNFAFTGDPLYPFLTSRYHLQTGWLGPSHLNAIPQMMGRYMDNVQSVALWFWQLLNATPYLGPASLILIVACFPIPRLRRCLPLLAACFLGLYLFSAIRFPEYFPRWLAPSLMFVGALGAIAFGEAIRALAELLPSRGARASLIALAVLGAIVTQRPDKLVDSRNLTRVQNLSPTFSIRDTRVHQGGDAMAWLRMNAKPDELILTTGFQLLYYVSNLRALAIVNDPLLDAELSSMTDLPTLVRALRRHDAKYLLDVVKWDARFYGPIGPVVAMAADDHPAAVVYEGRDSFILDLEMLSSELQQACEMKPGPSLLEA